MCNTSASAGLQDADPAVKIFYADANARITQNRGFDGQTICGTVAHDIAQNTSDNFLSYCPITIALIMSIRGTG